MTDLAQRFRSIAVEEGVEDQEARELARKYAREVRKLAAPDPDPDVVIQELGETRKILLKADNVPKDKAFLDVARKCLDNHEGNHNYECVNQERSKGWVRHTFEKKKEKEEEKSTSSDKSIEEKFRNMTDEEQRELLSSIVDD